jgi:hypothetical protein
MLKSQGAPCVLSRGAVGALGLLAVALCALAAPSRAVAWTDSSVRSVKALVTVAADGSARVALRVAVRVHGGWLEGLELAGLDPGLTLDPSAPTIVTGEDGAVYAPTVTVVADGTESTRVQLAFLRAGAPRRGAYEVALTYTTSLAHRATEPSSDGQSVRVSWTLPPWQTGLDGVELTLDVPGVARPAEEADAESDARAAQVSVVVEGGRTRLTWRRPHLPRTTVWTIVGEVPAGSLAASLRRVRAESAGLARGRSAPPTWPLALAVAVALLLLGTLAGRARRAALAYAGLATAPLVAMPRSLRALLGSAAVAAAPLCARAHPAFAALPLALLVALLLVRAGLPLDLGVGELRRERLAAREDLRAAARAVLRARWLTFDALLDATTLPGALFAFALVLGALLAYARLASNPAAPLLVLGAALACVPSLTLTRDSRRRAPVEALAMLRRIASRLRLAEDVPAALGLAVTTSIRGLTAARLVITPDSAPDGLRALDVVLAERAHGVTLATEPALRAVTRNGSDADRALASTLDDAVTSRGVTHTTRLAPVSMLEDALRALAAAACATAALLDGDDVGEDDAALSARLFEEPDYRREAVSSARSARSAD